VFVPPRGARREGVGDQDHEPGGNDGRFVILISPALVTAGRNGRPHEHAGAGAGAGAITDGIL
jgi:hypothetical protein